MSDREIYWIGVVVVALGYIALFHGEEEKLWKMFVRAAFFGLIWPLLLLLLVFGCFA